MTEERGLIRAGRERFGQGRRTEVWSEQEERGLVWEGEQRFGQSRKREVWSG